MSKNLTKTKSSNSDKKSLTILSLFFLGIIASAWMYSLNLRKTIQESNSVVNVDARALIEVEKLRNVAESQLNNSLNFFLMGSSTLFDDQKKDKQTFTENLASFEKNYNLPQVPEILRSLEAMQIQQQEIFDQAMDYRAKQTESKIVGQFYRSKTRPIRDQMNKALNEIVLVHNQELDRRKARAQEAALGAEVQIPQGMILFTALSSLLFAGMALLIVRTFRERSRQAGDRTRLYEEAKKAIQSRDEVLVAVSQDLKEPLMAVSQVTDGLKRYNEEKNLNDGIDLIKASLQVIDDRIKDILDQTKSDTGAMTLRLDQLAIDVVLDDAKLMLQTFAKEKDVRLEFNSVNPPALAFMDRERVMRVLSNIVGNAIKFSPKNSKVIVKVRSDQQFVFISVKDSGPGIPEKQLEGLFDNFWQARKTAEQGPGIGLAIVKTIIEAHGGKVHVESHVGHGSTFTFSLPRRRPVGANLGRPAASTVRHTARPAEFN